MNKPISTILKEQGEGVWKNKVSFNVLFDIKIEIGTVTVVSSILILFLACIVYSGEVFASADPDSGGSVDASPSFSNIEIIDPKIDWIDLDTRNFTKGGDRSTDIESVDYFSDGKTLNATLWLYFPFKMHPRLSDEYVNYGCMLMQILIKTQDLVELTIRLR